MSARVWGPSGGGLSHTNGHEGRGEGGGNKGRGRGRGQQGTAGSFEARDAWGDWKKPQEEATSWQAQDWSEQNAWWSSAQWGGEPQQSAGEGWWSEEWTEAAVGEQSFHQQVLQSMHQAQQAPATIRTGSQQTSSPKDAPTGVAPGFDGVDADWAAERELLCNGHRSSSVPRVENGAAANPATTRAQLKAAVFQLVDSDANGRLQCGELRRFAEQTGFEGSDDEWSTEYRMIVKDLGQEPSEGVDEACFCKMVDDRSPNGCFCSDDELRNMLETLVPLPHNASATRCTSAEAKAAGPAPEFASTPSSREELKVALFARLDTDSNGHLGSSELWSFVLSTGFDGSTAEWAEEYNLLCADLHCDPSVGMTVVQFSSMVDDESDKGCYCTDKELTAMLQDRAPPTGSVTAPAVVAEKANSTQGKDEASQSWEANFDPWAGKAQLSAAVGKGKAQGKGNGQNDPWEIKQDPWSTPSAKRMQERQQAREPAKVSAGGVPSAEGSREDKAAWGKWVEEGKTGAIDPSKPVLNVQKLMEAAKAANAARKVAEDAEQEEMPKEAPEPLPASNGDVSALKAHKAELIEQERPPPQAPKIVSAAAATAAAASAIARLAAGERMAAASLVDAVVGAPSSAHVLALASNSIRCLLQGRLDEARKLLSLEDLLLDPHDGEAAMLQGIAELAHNLGQAAAPLLLKMLLHVLAKVDDRRCNVEMAAVAATKRCAACVDVFAFEALMPPLLAALDMKRSPAVKCQALKLLAQSWQGKGELIVAQKLPHLIPATTALLLDTSLDVRTAAADAVEVLFGLSGNNDLQPYMAEIISCSRGKKDVAKCIKDLAEVVFVQQFEAPALAVLMPILTRGLKNRNMRIQRQASVIAENVCRLVPSVADVQPFVPQLLPLLKRVSEETADPDVRSVAGRAHASLAQIADADIAGSVRQRMHSALSATALMVEKDLRDGRGDVFTPCPASVRGVISDYAVTICVGLATCNILAQGQWMQHLLPYLDPLVGPRADKLVCDLREIGQVLTTKPCKKEGFWEDEGGNDSDGAKDKDVVCDCTLTLACGAATLLSGAHLKLVRGRVYGLVGANDSGKTTLLRAIHERKVVGFPPKSELRSVLVEHGLGEKLPECEWTPAEYLLAEPMIKALDQPKLRVMSALRNFGFEEGATLKRPIKTLSGGWRMKLGLARAMLVAADILLLDEPTGHLDAKNVDWLVAYIEGLQQEESQLVTTIIVSHSDSFLDKVCTHIVHVQDQKLKTFRGNFAKFIAHVPDAQLGSAIGFEEKPVAVFVLPEPGALEGVSSRGKRFLCLDDVSYSYPNGGSPAVRGATVECSLNSRVAIVGPNGAGKSTLAGLLVGELAPDKGGSTWRHPNLRIVLVAQHSFHHLEQHTDLTATQYILWRFEGNEDREALDFMAEEVETGETRTYCLQDDKLVSCDAEDPDAAEPEAILDRRQRGRFGYEYEVRWRGARSVTTWVPKWQILAMGCSGLAKREDARQAALHSLIGRPLTTPGVEAHLAGFGLDAEEASHRRLGALSNGQRARAVLGAATWLAPHLLVLDEPSNYLDQPALAALATGLQSFGGGVVVISHNTTLLDEICLTRWVMEAGRLQCDGAKVTNDPADTSVATNVNSASAAASKEAREKKKQKRIKELRRKNGEDVSDDEDWWEHLQQQANSKIKGA